jgi:hypothetical protein
MIGTAGELTGGRGAMHSRAEKLWLAGLTIAVLAAMELAGHITAQVPPCLVDPAGYGTAGACPLLHQFVLKHLADAMVPLREPHWLITVAAIAIGLSTLAWWRSTRRLMHATLDAAHAAKASAEALLTSEQAQLVAVLEAGNIPQMLSELGRGGSELGSQRIIVSFTVKNYGKTIALIKEISHELTHRKELPSHVRYAPIPNLPKERTLVAGATTEAIVCSMPAPLSASEAMSIRAGDSFLWLWGRVVYDDAFGREHEHRFVTRYRVGHGFQPHPHGTLDRNT